MFNRIYTLRNQIMHGGATWNSSVNRDQLRDCANLLGKWVPVIILLMLDNRIPCGVMLVIRLLVVDCG